MRRLSFVLGVLTLAGCTTTTTAGSAATTPRPTPAVVVSSVRPTLPVSDQDAALGPAGMTLSQEIGAVMMVGFQGPLTSVVVSDWRVRQFGGLIVVPQNGNAPDTDGTRQLISAVRSVMAHPLLVATTRDDGSPGLKALGFDIEFVPVSDARGVGAAIASIHAAGMDAAVETRGGADTAALRAAIAGHADLVMAGSLVAQPNRGSVAAGDVRMVRSQVGPQGVVISDDLEMRSSNQSDGAPPAAVRFLGDGGDMVVVSQHLETANAVYDAIHAAVIDGAYPRAQLDASVSKLLNLGLRFMP